MNASLAARRSLLTFCLLLSSTALFAQTATATKPFEPQVGQQGKDVVWVPTPQILVDKMLDMAKVTPQDFVLDLGSGDGRTVITAAKRGARSMGIEFNPDMVALSEGNAAKEGAAVTSRVKFMRGDLFEADLTQATVITMFLLPDINLKLRPKILNLKPGTRIVSNTFTMEEWEADETESVEVECTSWCTSLLWIVPAKVEGMWHLPQGDLTLKQSFQMLSGTLKTGNETTPITGRMRGEEITFMAGGARYTGRVTGNAMKGTLSAGGAWSATRM
jgi:SAM-dependent methyltransferase